MGEIGRLGTARMESLGRQITQSGVLARAVERLEDEGYTIPPTTRDRAIIAIGELSSTTRDEGLIFRDKHFETGVGLVRWLGSGFPRGPDDGAFPLLELVRSLVCEQRTDAPDTPYPDRHAETARLNLERLIAQTWGMLTGFCHRRGGDEETATIALGRAFVKFWSPDATDRFAGQSRVGTMLCAFARLVILEQDRGRSRVAGEGVGGVSGVPEPPGPAARREIRRAYEDCLGRLTPREQIIVDLHIRYHMPGKAIAERLGCVKSNVSNALASGLPRLRGCMESKDFSLSGE